MGKLLKILVVLLLLLSIGALVLGMMLFNKRELLKGRTQKLENAIVALGTAIEAEAPVLEEVPEFEARDISRVEAEPLDTPDLSPFWDDYKAELEVADRAVTLSLNVPPAVLRLECPLITSELVGKIPLADMFLEHPDGTPLDVTTDYFGKAIDPAKVKPGPFQSIEPGDNRLRLWPK